jgi:hypothetical protein
LPMSSIIAFFREVSEGTNTENMGTPEYGRDRPGLAQFGWTFNDGAC